LDCEALGQTQHKIFSQYLLLPSLYMDLWTTKQNDPKSHRHMPWNLPNRHLTPTDARLNLNSGVTHGRRDRWGGPWGHPW
jgi:hypothetical protein